MSFMYDDHGNQYLDFFSGAGALNYGHNNEYIISKIVDYIHKDGILHALDMHTEAKRNFIESFQEYILKPRNLKYKLLFSGPTGTDAIEVAIKIARKIKNRNIVFSFSGAYHGMTLGSLSLTSNLKKRQVAGTSLNDVVFMPFPYGFNKTFDTIDYIENILNDDHSGIEKPACIIVETIQAEGGVIIADYNWLQQLRKLCNRHNIILICDEIQVGCCRTGTFFSFEHAGIVPDIVTLSKSISGIGLPMSLVLLRPEYDVLSPGDHRGTFRGNQLAFVGATAAIHYILENNLLRHVVEKNQIINEFIEQEILTLYPTLDHRGIGLIHAIDFNKMDSLLCQKVITHCFQNKLIIESSGRNGGVLKILPPLIITSQELLAGLNIIKNAILNCIHY